MARPTREEILQTIVKLIHDYVPGLENAELTEDSRINTDASVDSMSMILIISKAESAFNITIPHENWDKISTLGEFADAVEAALPED